MLIKNIFVVILLLFAGVSTGIAAVALINTLGFVAQVIFLTDDIKNVKAYNFAIIIGIFVFTVSYFLDINLNMPSFVAAIVFVLQGVFLGMLTVSAVELMDTLPMFTGKMSRTMKKVAVFILLFSKVIFSLLDFLVIN